MSILQLRSLEHMFVAAWNGKFLDDLAEAFGKYPAVSRMHGVRWLGGVLSMSTARYFGPPSDGHQLGSRQCES